MVNRIRRRWDNGTTWLTLLYVDENETEEFQSFLQKIDALANPDPDKAFLKLNPNEKDKYKIYP